MTWMVRAQTIASDGTSKRWERTFQTKPVVQVWQSGKACCAEEDYSFFKAFRRVDWIEYEEIKDADE